MAFGFNNDKSKSATIESIAASMFRVKSYQSSKLPIGDHTMIRIDITDETAYEPVGILSIDGSNLQFLYLNYFYIEKIAENNFAAFIGLRNTSGNAETTNVKIDVLLQKKQNVVV